MVEAFTDHRLAALALLNGNCRLTRAAGQFLGHLAVDPSPLTEKQLGWLDVLLEKNGFPPFTGEGRQ